MNDKIKDNEKIARFMGARPSPNHKPSDLYLWFDPALMHTHLWSKNKLEYHKSWEWLMPVVDKILGMGIEYVYQAVVNFIDWYNENEVKG